MTFILNSFQSSAVSALTRALESQRAALLSAPCGAGKSVILSDMARTWRAQGLRVLVVTRALEVARHLACQLGDAATVATVKSATSARNVAELAIFDIVAIDEAHDFEPASAQYGKLLRHVRPDAKIVGFTATPYRMEKTSTSPIFGPDKLFPEITASISKRALAAAGKLFIVEPANTSRSIETKTLKRNATGDFIYDVKEARRDGLVSIIIADVKAALANHGDMPILINTSSIAYAEEVHTAFQAAGFVGEIVHSKLPNKDNQTAIAAFKAGASQYLVSVSILSVGFDAPLAGLCVFAFPTVSRTRFEQAVGRVARCTGETDAAGKRGAYLLDYGAHDARFGPLDMEPHEALAFDAQRERRHLVQAIMANIASDRKRGVPRQYQLTPSDFFDLREDVLSVMGACLSGVRMTSSGNPYIQFFLVLDTPRGIRVTVVRLWEGPANKIATLFNLQKFSEHLSPVAEALMKRLCQGDAKAQLRRVYNGYYDRSEIAVTGFYNPRMIVRDVCQREQTVARWRVFDDRPIYDPEQAGGDDNEDAA